MMGIKNGEKDGYIKIMKNPYPRITTHPMVTKPNSLYKPWCQIISDCNAEKKIKIEW